SAVERLLNRAKPSDLHHEGKFIRGLGISLDRSARAERGHLESPFHYHACDFLNGSLAADRLHVLIQYLVYRRQPRGWFHFRWLRFFLLGLARRSGGGRPHHDYE